MSSRFSSPNETKRFIRKDLKDTLKWLLISTALWRYYSKLDEIHGEEVAMAMHTNLVSSRALFEFFICTSDNDAHISDLGIPSPYKSRRYRNSSRRSAWREPINRHLAHISIGRVGVNRGKRGPTNVIGNRHLKNMMPEFEAEILRLWNKLENDPNLPSGYRKALIDVRLRAEDDRKNALDRFSGVYVS